MRHCAQTAKTRTNDVGVALHIGHLLPHAAAHTPQRARWPQAVLTWSRFEPSTMQMMQLVSDGAAFGGFGGLGGLGCLDLGGLGGATCLDACP